MAGPRSVPGSANEFSPFLSFLMDNLHFLLSFSFNKSTITNREIIIIGGGIIGCTTAYYLTRHLASSSSSSPSTKITLIEASAHGPAQGASGKAGGLVARWAYPKEIVDVSFDEHVKLASEHDGEHRWGWRYVGCGSWEGRGEVVSPSSKDNDGELEDGPKGTKSLEKTLGLPARQKPNPKSTRKGRKANPLPDDLTWVDESLTDSYTPMAKSGATAQVHPYLFTTSMFELAKANGLTYINGNATSILKSNGSVSGVEYKDPKTHETRSLPATHVILAAGAWSPSLVEDLPISSTRAHSITIRPKPGITIAPYVLFTEIADTDTIHSSPEIYARPDNEVYACGPGDDCPLPPTVDDVVVDQSSCDTIYAHVSSISPQLREGAIEKRQACYLPTVLDGGGPIIGEARKIAKGLYIGTGHTCWGISNAPGTARALTELIMNGKITCANLRKLDPAVSL